MTCSSINSKYSILGFYEYTNIQQHNEQHNIHTEIRDIDIATIILPTRAYQPWG